MGLYYLSLPFFVLLLLLVLYVLLSKKRNDCSATRTPRLTRLQYLRNAHRILQWTTDVLCSSTDTLTFHTPDGVLTADPAIVEHVVKSRFPDYPKSDGGVSVLDDLLGGGIFNADGDLWLSQRKSASHEFSTRTIRTFVLSIAQEEIFSRLVPLLRDAASAGGVVELQDLLERFAFDNICRVALDTDPERVGGVESSEGAQFHRAFEEATLLSIDRFKYNLLANLFWKARKLVGASTERRLRRALVVINDYVIRAVKTKRRTIAHEGSTSCCNDLLTRFILENKGYSDEYLRDITVSFILAGRDTTSASLTWFFWLISTNPETERKILEEIALVRSRNGSKSNRGEAFTLEELREMDYLHAALSETMRLYPPVSLLPRTCVAEKDCLPGGTDVRKGSVVMYSLFAMARMESIWGSDCLEFRPERWVDKEGRFQAASPYKYPVFHGGPRMCLGKEMAYTQMKAVAATLMERFEVEVVDKDAAGVPHLALVLRMKGGLPVKVRERNRTRTRFV